MHTITKFVTITLTACTVALCGMTYAHAAPADAAKAPAPKAPIGILTATCNDGGAYYHVTGEHRGACSGHGGVASWADGSPVHTHAARTDYRPAKKGK